jgi:hypothetical protein
VTTEWAALCAAPDFALEDAAIVVRFADDRTQRVSVTDDGTAFVLCSFVARRAAVASIAGIDDLALRAWQRNRTVALVGFRVDARERLVGEAWVPKAGLSAAEFQLAVRTVAAECDRLEYILTGRDTE